MDPGARRDLVSVYYREPVNGDFGTTYTLVHKGDFWASYTEITRSLFYSGSEAIKTQKINLLQPGVRFVFDMDYKFDEDKVEFHFAGQIFVARDDALRIGSTRNTKFSYNCLLQKKRAPGE